MKDVQTLGTAAGRFFLFITRKSKITDIVFAFLGSFLLSQAVILERFSPFSISLISAMSGYGLAAAAAGAAVGLLFQPAASALVKYIGGIALVCTIKWICGFKREIVQSRFFSPIAAFVSCLVSGVSLCALIGITQYDLLLCVSESAIAGGTAFFFRELYDAGESGISPFEYNPVQLAGLTVFCGLVLLVLSKLQIGYLNIGRTAAVIAVLFCASVLNGKSACVLGVTLGFLFVLYDPTQVFMPVLLGLGGIICSLMSQFSKIGTVIGMFWSFMLVLTVTYNTENIPLVMYDTLCACAVFLCIPKKFIGFISAKIVRSKLEGFDEVKRAYMTKVSFLSQALSDVGSVTEQVAKKLNSSRRDGTGAVFEKTYSQVCADCGLKSVCWTKIPTDTVKAFSDMIPILKKDGYIGELTLPEHFKTRCCRAKQIVSQTNLNFTEYVAGQTAKRRIGEVRKVISGQFEAMASVLDRLSGELEDIRSIDMQTTAAVKNSLDKLGLQLDFCYCLVGELDRMTVEFCVKEVTKESVPYNVLTELIANITERDFESPTVSSIGKLTRYTFNERANYRMETDLLQIPHDKTKICGDTCSSFTDSRHYFNIVISDGMGKGKPAAIDSAMTVSLITKLIKSGFDYSNSIKMINSALLVKSDEETLSTIDTAQVDLYTGRLRIMKAGAPLTVVVKDRRPIVVESCSVPIGIVNEIAPCEQEMFLSANDLVVMMSDGVCENGYDYILEILKKHSDLAPCELTQKIMSACVEKSGGVTDDLTVIVARLAINA